MLLVAAQSVPKSSQQESSSYSRRRGVGPIAKATGMWMVGSACAELMASAIQLNVQGCHECIVRVRQASCAATATGAAMS
jgi:hypothetical protein